MIMITGVRKLESEVDEKRSCFGKALIEKYSELVTIADSIYEYCNENKKEMTIEELIEIVNDSSENSKILLKYYYLYNEDKKIAIKLSMENYIYEIYHRDMLTEKIKEYNYSVVNYCLNSIDKLFDKYNNLEYYSEMMDIKIVNEK